MIGNFKFPPYEQIGQSSFMQREVQIGNGLQSNAIQAQKLRSSMMPNSPDMALLINELKRDL
jgi:hypothetical protein